MVVSFERHCEEEANAIGTKLYKSIAVTTTTSGVATANSIIIFLLVITTVHRCCYMNIQNLSISNFLAYNTLKGRITYCAYGKGF
jgi:hypothetical protein